MAFFLGDILGSHGGEYEDNLLGYCVVYCPQTTRKSLL
jgi:hypothetical protein